MLMISCNEQSGENYPSKKKKQDKKEQVFCLSDSCRIVKLRSYWITKDKLASVESQLEIKHHKDSTEFIYVIAHQRTDTIYTGMRVLEGTASYKVKRRCIFNLNGKIISDTKLDTVEAKLQTCNNGGVERNGYLFIAFHTGPIDLLDQPYGKVIAALKDKNKILYSSRSFSVFHSTAGSFSSATVFHLVNYKNKKYWILSRQSKGCKMMPNEGSGGGLFCYDEIFLKNAD